MLTVFETWQRLAGALTQLPPRPVTQLDLRLASAAGRVLADDLLATRSSPACDVSTMDGYSLRAQDDMPAGTRFGIRGNARAGHAPPNTDASLACRVQTGAPIPFGHNAVVPQERVVVADDTITLQRDVAPQACVRKEGSEYRLGDVVLRAGTRIDAVHLGILAEHATMINVRIPPRLGLLSNGDELVEQAQATHQRTDLNQPILEHRLRALGIEDVERAWASDNLASVKHAIAGLSETNDVIVSSGGVSVGDVDFVPQALVELGFTLHVRKVSMKPGKPLVFATQQHAGRTLIFFGLPGNPVSAYTTCAMWVEPFVRGWMGEEKRFALCARARLSQTFTRAEREAERTDLVRVAVDAEGLLAPVISQDSGALISLRDADGWMLVPRGATLLEPDQTVRWLSTSSLGAHLPFQISD